MTHRPFYKNFHFTQYGRVIQSPTKNRIGYIQLKDSTIIEIRDGVIELTPPLKQTHIRPQMQLAVTFTIPEETNYPQALTLALKK